MVVMERQKMTLRDQIRLRRETRRAPPFYSTEGFLSILLRIITAVDHMVRHRVVHRDIKPDNILLGGPDLEGYPDMLPLVKIADFGECLDLIEGEFDGFKMDFPTRHISRGGAASYLAPEVLAVKPKRGAVIDYAMNDIFACGMVAHNMLSGDLQRPFEADTARDYSTDNYNELPPCYDDRICSLVRRMCHPDAAKRLTAEQALSRANELLIDDVSVSASRQSSVSGVGCEQVELLETAIHNGDTAVVDSLLLMGAHQEVCTEYAPIPNRPGARLLDALLQSRTQATGLFQIDRAEWEPIYVVVQTYVQAQISEAQDPAVSQLLRVELPRLLYHEEMYVDTMVSVRNDNNFHRYVAMLDEVKQRVEERNTSRYPNAKPRQTSSDLLDVLNGGEKVQQQYHMLVSKLVANCGGKHIEAPLKSPLRALVKIGVRPADKEQWSAAVLTDIVRGAIEMPSTGFGGGWQLLKVLIGFDRDESAFTPFKSGCQDKGLEIVIVGVKNRWVKPAVGGWCDALLTFYFANDPDKHICEIQLVHSLMVNVRKQMDAHKMYTEVRNAEELLEAAGVML